MPLYASQLLIELSCQSSFTYTTMTVLSMYSAKNSLKDLFFSLIFCQILSTTIYIVYISVVTCVTYLLYISCVRV